MFILDKRLYNSTVACPVCSNSVEVTKVKSKSCKIASRDSDFCVYYEDLNPILYDIWVCDSCGFAAQPDKFNNVTPAVSKSVQRFIKPKWNKRSFSGERTIDQAIEAFKLALYILQLTKGKYSDMAKVCIRIAWLYRIKKDEKEQEFLKHAEKCYLNIYEKEPLPVDKLDKDTCMYMIAELNRRMGKLEDSIQWFSRVISSPDARKNNVLMESTREQYQLAKEQLKALKKTD